MADLEAQLREAQGARLRLVATDGVFSMDGDIAPLRDICALAREYGAYVFVGARRVAACRGRWRVLGLEVSLAVELQGLLPRQLQQLLICWLLGTAPSAHLRLRPPCRLSPHLQTSATPPASWAPPAAAPTSTAA
jgi:hypothetical protein